MNCHQMDTILDDHAVRSLSAAQRSEVDAHLASCARCSGGWLGHQALAGDSPGEPRPEFFGEVAAHVVAERPRVTTRRFASWFGLASAVAVAAAAVLANSSLFRHGTMPEAVDVESRPAGENANIDMPAPLESAQIVAGQHYRVLPTPVPTASGADKIEVTEFFMVDCLPCFSFEPTLEAWRQRQPGYVELVRVPSMFKPTAMLHAQAFYTAEALGKLDEMRMPFYEEVHVRGNTLATEVAMEAFFGRFGIDAKSFGDAFNSPGVRAKVQHAVELNQRYGVSAIPSIGVNGRYITNPSMAGSHAVLDVVDALVRAEVRESCQDSNRSTCPVF